MTVEQRKGMSEFLEHSVLADPLFQSNPRGYLAKWQENRGGFEMLMVPQDPAQGFLEELARKGQLDSFAQEIKRSGLAPKAGVELESKNWK